MRNRARPAAAAFLVFLLLPGAGLAEARFGRAVVYLERNVTDQDAEIRFEVTGGEDGLVALRVVAPDGRTVLDFRAPESRLGIRQPLLRGNPVHDSGTEVMRCQRRALHPTCTAEMRP